MDNFQQQPPHSIQAEQSLLGAILIDGDIYHDIKPILAAIDFYQVNHRTIYTAIEAVNNAGIKPDLVTVQSNLDDMGVSEDAGGFGYLAEICNNTPSTGNATAYAKVVKEKSKLRMLITMLYDVGPTVHNPQELSSADIIADIQHKLNAISDSGDQGNEIISLNQGLTLAASRIDELAERGSGLSGLATGFSELDKMTRGLQKTDLVIVGGRPSMGKTAFLSNLIEAIILAGHRFLFFSSEMKNIGIINRLISSLGGMDLSKILGGTLDQNDWVSLGSAINQLKDRALFIDDTKGITIAQIRSKIRSVQKEHGPIDAIGVDYIQIMGGDQRHKEGERIKANSAGLKGIADEFNIPVIALSQLNRNLEQRQSKRPINSDLKGASDIEQDADLIMLLYRDSIYNAQAPKDEAELIISKQRNGAIGSIPLDFEGSKTRFSTRTPEYYGGNKVDA